VTAAYWPENGDTFQPLILPTRCLCADGAGPGCRITVHHLRERKTGPAFPVAVLKCKVHGRAFTLYPLGHVPYGRVAVAPVSVDGEPLRPASGADSDDGNLRSRPGRDGWSQTLFGAALDAASGEPWPREAENGACWETQRRHLAEAARIFGIWPAPPVRIGESIAVALEVPRLTLLEAARDDAAGGGGFQSRGEAIARVLTSMPSGRCVLDRVLDASVRVGRWAEIHRWERAHHGPLSKVFRGGGIPDG
jgi:hypothetical protein